MLVEAKTGSKKKVNPGIWKEGGGARLGIREKEGRRENLAKKEIL